MMLSVLLRTRKSCYQPAYLHGKRRAQRRRSKKTPPTNDLTEEYIVKKAGHISTVGKL